MTSNYNMSIITQTSVHSHGDRNRREQVVCKNKQSSSI